MNARTIEANVTASAGSVPNAAANALAPVLGAPVPAGPAERLFTEGHAYDFFQAVRLLEKLDRDRVPVGRGGPPRKEAVRFRALQSLSFPPSAIYELQRPATPASVPEMTVAFLGLTGPSGALPQHYTEMILRLRRDAEGAEKYALRDWLDLFNHRLISLFFRAWEKYRFYIAYERQHDDGTAWRTAARTESDPFTQALYSLIGLAAPSLRKRLRVSCWEEQAGEPRERVLAQVDDLALLHFSGFLAQQTRCAANLEALLRDYFQLPIELRQFQGQWLRLEPENQSRMGGTGDCRLGVNVVAGERVWDVQSKFRIRLGPLRYEQFTELLPDRTPVPARKTFFLLAHLVRLYVGPEFDFDVQLVLRAAEIPLCQLEETARFSPRLGWNTWLSSEPFLHDAAEAVFAGEEVRWLQ